MSIRAPKQRRRPAAPPVPESAASRDPQALRPSPFLRQAVLLLAATLLVYLPALKIGFIWDDDTHLTANILTEPNGLWRTWFTTEQPNYWPITWTAFWLQWKIFALAPLGYHVVNVLLHGLNAILVWQVLRRLAIPGAWLAALVFAVHPVNVETAAWVTQLKSLLAMGFYLGAILYYLRSESSPTAPRWYASAITLFLIAMLSKPSVVTLPLVLLLLAWWQRARVTRRDLLRSLPFFAISGVLSLAEIWFQYTRSIAETVVRTDGFLARLAGAGWVVWFYLSKILAPIDLMFVYPRWEINPAALLTWLPLTALLGAFAVLVWKRHSWGRPALFALGYFVITLLPVLGFLNIFYMRYSFVADHWQYQSMPAIVALVVGAGVHLARTRFPHNAALIPAVAAPLVLVLAVVSALHQRSYWSIETLWEETLKRNPKAWIAHQCLGEYFSRQNRLDKAIAHFSEELMIVPNFAEPYYNLGIAYAAQGRTDEALKHYARAAELDPKSAEAHNNAGVLLASLGRFDEAVTQYQLALKARPSFPDAHINWGLALAAQKRFDEAIRHYAEALKLAPASSAAHTNWGAALLAQGKAPEAVEHLSRATELDPASPESHLNLGRALAAAGRPEEAIQRAQHALRLNPNYPAAHQSLAAWTARLQGAGRPPSR